jgi:hypothetical protein
MDTESTEDEDLSNASVESIPTRQVDPAFINPPIEGVNIEYVEVAFSAEDGVEYTYASGNQLIIPLHSLVDAEGAPITGDVTLRTREFRDPFDFYIAGIPMNYDSAGTSYTFESYGMFEVLVEQNGQPVYVNPDNKPRIELTTENRPQSENIYRLDTVSEQWVLANENAKTIQPEVIETVAAFDESTSLPSLPKKPEKANPNKPSLYVTFEDAALFPELAVFENTKFEIDDSDTSYNPSDGDIEWNSVRLNRTEDPEVYLIQFSKYPRKVSYRVRPVYEGKNFDAALKVYNEKKAEYDYRLEQIRKENAARAKALQVRSSFELANFGIWNCDRVITAKKIPLLASFVNEEGDTLKVSQLAIASAELNGVFSFFSNQISVYPEVNHCLWGIANDDFVYFTFEDFKNTGITPNTKEFTFTMRTYSGEITVYQVLKDLLGF